MPSAARRRLDRGHELEIVLDGLERRHEDVQHAAARLGADGRAHDVRIDSPRAGSRLAAADGGASVDAGPRLPHAGFGQAPANRLSSLRPIAAAPRRARPPEAARVATGRARRSSGDPPAPPTAANRAAAEIPWANRRASDTSARSRRNHGPVRHGSGSPLGAERQRVADDRIEPCVKTRRSRSRSSSSSRRASNGSTFTGSRRSRHR